MMKRFLVIWAITLTTSFQVGASAWPEALDGTAEKIRSGELDVGKEYTLDFSGRFHTIHAKALGMGCLACHAKPAYAPDHLYLRAAEFPQRGHPGAVPRGVCIGCHSERGAATPWYSSRAK